MTMAGKTVLVTGGGSGVGRAVAMRIVEQGGAVVAMGRRPRALAEVAAATSASAGRLIPCAGDAGVPADAGAAVALAVEQLGRLDAVIACAGTLEIGGVADIADDSWRRVLHSNLDSAFVTARAALPALIAARGAMVFVASTASFEAIPNAASYMVAKHALVGLMRSIALDYGPRGVRANAVCPGWIRTPMADDELGELMAQERLDLDEAYARVTADTPLRRPALPTEIANLCCYLASDDAAIISGTCVMADGGSTIVSAPSLRM